MEDKKQPATYLSVCYFTKGFFPRLVVDIYSPINEQINSTIFNGCCVVLHGKDTLFFSEKQTINKQQKGRLAPFQKNRHSVMRLGLGEASLPGFQVAAFSVFAHMVGREQVL